MEDSSPHSRHTYRNGGGGGHTGTHTCWGGSAGTDTSLGSNNAQEAKEMSEQATTEERGDIQDMSLDGEEKQHTGSLSTTETS
jgi:hypothetical protein